TVRHGRPAGHLAGLPNGAAVFPLPDDDRAPAFQERRPIPRALSTKTPFLSESALSRGWLGQARRGGRGDPAPGNRRAAPRLSPHCRAAPVMIPMCAKRAAGNRRVRHGPPPLAATLVGILALLLAVGQPFVVARENARSSSSSLFVPDKG